jgi:hypothetical protein
MRAFHPMIILLNTWYLAMARLPYIKSSGYYSPYPPENNRVLYEFAPLAPSGGDGGQTGSDQQQKSRETRDLAWREFDAFLRGDEEPGCADLRRMWRLARQLQDKALETNVIPQEMHPFTASQAFYKTRHNVDKASGEQGGRPAAAAGTQSTKGMN